MSELMKQATRYQLLSVITLLILAYGPLYPQKGMHYGISIGIQNTLLRSKGYSEIDVKNAFCPLVTADIEYGFSDYFAIQSGIGYALYSQNTGKFRNNFNYLVVPLYLRYGGFRNNRRFALSLFGGANYKFLVSASNIYRDEKNDIADYTRGFHRDYTAGVGMIYKLDDSFVLESHLTGTFLGGSFNKISTDGFLLRNFNYGAVIGFRYRFR